MNLWIVCFTNCGDVWWRWFTKPGFRHAFAMTYDVHFNHWLVFEWHRYGALMYPITSATAETILNTLEARGGEAWTIKQREQKPSFPIGVLPLHCVSAMKHILGIRSWAITPWQLRSELSRRGARRIVSSHDGNTTT